MASPFTPLLAVPVPSRLHVVPFHFARPLAAIPPAWVKPPPTYTSPLLATVIAQMPSFTPFHELLPIEFQLFPFHLETLLAVKPSATVKAPPAYRSPLLATANALIMLLACILFVP